MLSENQMLNGGENVGIFESIFAILMLIGVSYLLWNVFPERKVL